MTAIVVLTTLGANSDVERLAQTLVDERLAACVNVLAPMRSVYRWQGHLQIDDERQLVIKTSAASLAPLEARVRELHPYELPEWLVIEAGGSSAYLDWIGQETRR